ncbi:DegT/DnrJ/EryC1/StrS family aminotransferase [Limisalsivibrio acetivorans]|uniref:DegT/DnrJ/EryC1/StrS family aminotransferase n=1 Tax=Limisalsivibrio acetivorans TaxID=1304888 RepID=UPI0003B5B663|nr:DegT/DnrJ/EryC1/StrS family aminotransferase [Limisalsivibrio acetivorans]
MKIPITKPYFDNCEKKGVLEPIESGWLVQGPKVEEFENLFREFTGSKYAVATTSCTTALHLSLEAMGVGPGDRVLVPAFTYAASANAVLQCGAEPVFCDIDVYSFNMTVASLKKALQLYMKPAAVMPVNMFGLCAPLPEIAEICAKERIKVVEDSACGFGAFIGDKHSGTFGDAGCFSFHPRKAITTGEGGMLVTEDPDIAAKAASMRNHGTAGSDLQRHMEGISTLPEFSEKGFNYRMTDIQASIGICQMKKAQYILGERTRIADIYRAELKGTALSSASIPDGYTHGWQSCVFLYTEGEEPYSLELEDVDRLNGRRNLLMRSLQEKGISTRQGSHAVHNLNFYKEHYRFKREHFPGADMAEKLSIALPLYAGMTDRAIEYVINSVKELCG